MSGNGDEEKGSFEELRAVVVLYGGALLVLALIWVVIKYLKDSSQLTTSADDRAEEQPRARELPDTSPRTPLSLAPTREATASSSGRDGGAAGGSLLGAGAEGGGGGGVGAWGLDAMAFVRVIRLGLLLAAFGCFNALWLVPLYRTSPQHPSTANVTDIFDELTLANVPTGDQRLYGAVIATYTMTGLCLLLLIDEVKWYIAERHRLACKPLPHNLSLYLGGIPLHLRSHTALAAYIEAIFPGRLIEVKFALHVPLLHTLCSKRDALQRRLESLRETRDAARDHAPSSFSLCPRGRGGYQEEMQRTTVELASVRTQIRAEQEAVRRKCDEHEAHHVISPHAPLARPPLLLDSAILVLSSFQAAAAAGRVMHASEPATLTTARAPPPHLLQWSALGASHRRALLGRSLASLLVAALCVLWSAPVSALRLLVSVDRLQASFPLVRSALQTFPLLLEGLAALSSLLLVLLLQLLPILLRRIVALEQHISREEEQLSLFRKLSLILTIQVLVVSSAAGAVGAGLGGLLEAGSVAELTDKALALLGTSLPGQAAGLMAFALASASLDLLLLASSSLQAHRPSLSSVAPAPLPPPPAAVGRGGEVSGRMQLRLREQQQRIQAKRAAWQRRAERLRRLGGGQAVALAQPLAQAMLLFALLLVYAPLAPTASLVMLVAFLVKGVVYHRRLILLPPPPASALSPGRLWPALARTLLASLLLSQVCDQCEIRCEICEIRCEICEIRCEICEIRCEIRCGETLCLAHFVPGARLCWGVGFGWECDCSDCILHPHDVMPASL